MWGRVMKRSATNFDWIKNTKYWIANIKLKHEIVIQKP